MVPRVTIDEVLEHHGIKGMKWGRRTKSDGGASSTPSSHDAARATEYASRAKSGGTKSLSNQELQHLVNRMNLEQNYSRLASTKSSPAKKGARVAGQILSNAGKQTASEFTKAAIAKQIAKAMAKKAAVVAVSAAL